MRGRQPVAVSVSVAVRQVPQQARARAAADEIRSVLKNNQINDIVVVVVPKKGP